MSFDKFSGFVVLALAGLVLGVSGIALIRSDSWWLMALGFPCIAYSCDMWDRLRKRIWP